MYIRRRQDDYPIPERRLLTYTVFSITQGAPADLAMITSIITCTYIIDPRSGDCYNQGNLTEYLEIELFKSLLVCRTTVLAVRYGRNITY